MITLALQSGDITLGEYQGTFLAITDPNGYTLATAVDFNSTSARKADIQVGEGKRGA
jgi:hypothetical protein